jgi:hypothetical protein
MGAILLKNKSANWCSVQAFATDLAPLLSEQTIPAEHILIKVTPRVIDITHSFAPKQIEALLSFCFWH